MDNLKILENDYLDNQQTEIIHNYIKSIINIYKKEQGSSSDISEIEYVIEQCDLNKEVLPMEIERDKLELINLKIREQGEIKKQPVNYFITYKIPSNQIFTTNLYLAQARLLCAANKLKKFGGYEDFIANAFRQFRLLISGKSWDILNKLPSFTLNKEELIKELDKIEKLSILRIKPIKVVFEKLGKKVEHSKNFKKIYSRNIKSIKTTNDSRINEITNIEYLQNFLVNKEYTNVEKEERIADQAAVIRYRKFELIEKDDVQKSLSLQISQLKKAKLHMLKNDKKLLTSINILTNRDIEILFKFCIKKIKVNECPLLLLSLFLGRNLLKIKKSQLIKSNLIQKSKQDHYCLSFIPKLPKHDVSEDRINTLINRPTGKVVLPIPVMFNNSIKAILNRTVNIEKNVLNINEIIKVINSEFNTNLTYKRIYSHFENWMANRGVDTSVISFLLDKVSYNTAGCYYYQPTSTFVTDVNIDYQKYLYKQIGINQPTKFVVEDNSIKVGSQIGVSPSKINQLFKSMRTRLLELQENVLDKPYEYHNLLVIYLLTLLNLSCGHRPVGDPYESLNNIDLNSKTVFINDKETKSEVSSRIIPLPEIAVSQINEYLEHLKQLADLIEYSNRKVFNYIINTFNNEGSPLFFIIDNDIQKIRPAILENQLSNIWPLRINWYRHHMRTKLRSWNISGEIVDAWMGHSGYGGSGFGMHSGLSINDLQNVSCEINEYLITDLSFQLVKSWNI